MHLYKGLLELNPFSQAPRGCLRMLSPQVRTVHIGPGEVLLAQNDVINAIYYIASGSMEVLQGESVAAILGKSIIKFQAEESVLNFYLVVVMVTKRPLRHITVVLSVSFV